jgi:AraC-like DNA-binding protein
LQRLYELLQSAAVDHPIAMLAQHCGLIDPANLSQMFRRRFGISPSELRAGRLSSEDSS